METKMVLNESLSFLTEDGKYMLQVLFIKFIEYAPLMEMRKYNQSFPLSLSFSKASKYNPRFFGLIRASRLTIISSLELSGGNP